MDQDPSGMLRRRAMVAHLKHLRWERRVKLLEARAQLASEILAGRRDDLLPPVGGEMSADIEELSRALDAPPMTDSLTYDPDNIKKWKQDE